MKCFHCDIEYEKPKIPECWVVCCSKQWLCSECKTYMRDCIFAWNKAHGLKLNGEPPGEVRTVKDNWTEYNRKMGVYPKREDVPIGEK